MAYEQTTTTKTNPPNIEPLQIFLGLAEFGKSGNIVHILHILLLLHLVHIMHIMHILHIVNIVYIVNIGITCVHLGSLGGHLG